MRKDLADQKARLEFVEKRRREKEMKKYGKQVQAEQMQRKAKERKKELERVDKWRKGTIPFRPLLGSCGAVFW